MTLEQVRSEMQVLFCTEVTTEDLDRWSDAIDAHLGRQSEGVSDEAKLFSGDLEVLASLGFPKIADRIRAALTAVLHNRPAQEQHPDDMAVDSFALAMKVKLAEARAKGRSGWQDKDDCPQQRLSDMLRNHVEKGDPRDVANFCMFLHQRGESILPAQEKAGPVAGDFHTMNSALCNFAMRWEMDGDYLRCRKCKRPQITDYAHVDFAHASECKAAGKVEPRPWETLIALLAPLYTAPPVERVSVPDGWDIRELDGGFIHVESPQGLAVNLGYLPEGNATASQLLQLLATDLLSAAPEANS